MKSVCFIELRWNGGIKAKLGAFALIVGRLEPEWLLDRSFQTQFQPQTSAAVQGNLPKILTIWRSFLPSSYNWATRAWEDLGQNLTAAYCQHWNFLLMQNELVSLLSSLIKMIKIVINSTKSVVCPFSEIWAGAFQVSSKWRMCKLGEGRSVGGWGSQGPRFSHLLVHFSYGGGQCPPRFCQAFLAC